MQVFYSTGMYDILYIDDLVRFSFLDCDLEFGLVSYLSISFSFHLY